MRIWPLLNIFNPPLLCNKKQCNFEALSCRKLKGPFEMVNYGLPPNWHFPPQTLFYDSNIGHRNTLTILWFCVDPCVLYWLLTWQDIFTHIHSLDKKGDMCVCSFYWESPSHECVMHVLEQPFNTNHRPFHQNILHQSTGEKITHMCIKKWTAAVI